MSLAPLDSTSSDMTRESLGILPSTILCRDSPTIGLSSVKELLDTSMPSPRESLGLLNLSAMDLGRESIGIFNIQNQLLGRKSTGNEILENYVLSDFNFENRLNRAFLVPHSRVLLSSGSSNVSSNPSFHSKSLDEPSKILSLSSQKIIESSAILATSDPFNEAFQISTSDNKNSVSQIVTEGKNPLADHFQNTRNRIQSLPVTLEDNNMFADLNLKITMTNVSFPTDVVCRGVEDDSEFDDFVFLEAKKVASIIADTSFVGDENSDLKEPNILDATPQPEWPTELDSSQNNLEEKLKSPNRDKEKILKQVDNMLGMQPVSLEEKLKIKSLNSDSNSPENQSENVNKVSKPPRDDKKWEQIATPNFSGNLLCNISKNSQGNEAENQSCGSNNFSQNISKISRSSQDGITGNYSCGSNNFSHNLSKITQISEENVSRLLQNLSDILNDNENFSQSQKKEGQHLLRCLTELFNNNKVSSSAEDSGHSSVEGNRSEERKNDKNVVDNECKLPEGANANNCEEMCQALDLSYKGKNGSTEIKKGLPASLSPLSMGVSTQYVIKTPNHISQMNTSSTSITSNLSDTNNKNSSKAYHSRANNRSDGSTNSLNKSSASRESNISQNRISVGSGKLRKSKVGNIASKKGPLRAVLPVENMAKGSKSVPKSGLVPSTPEKNDSSKVTLRSKRTSTPIQEPKLKPMAASTPAMRQSKGSKENVSPALRPKYSRSFSHQSNTSNNLQKPENVSKITRESISGASKHVINKSRSNVEGSYLVRRNSMTEGTLSLQNDNDGPTRIKRSFSTGKEPKILSALTRVRQNILNSPYYNPKKGPAGSSQMDVLREHVEKMDLKKYGQELKKLSMVSQPKKSGKENLKP